MSQIDEARSCTSSEFVQCAMDEIYRNITKLKKCIENPMSECFHDCPWCDEFDSVVAEMNIRGCL